MVFAPDGCGSMALHSMPARAAHAAGGFPMRAQPGFSLPDGKVGDLSFRSSSMRLRSSRLPLSDRQIQVAQLAVAGRSSPGSTSPFLANVKMAGVDQIFDDIEDLGDMLGSAGLHSGLFAVQPAGIPFKAIIQSAGPPPSWRCPLPVPFDELIVDIGDVGNVDHLVAPVFQIAAQVSNTISGRALPMWI